MLFLAFLQKKTNKSMKLSKNNNTKIGIDIKKQISIPIIQEFLKKISTAYCNNLTISTQNATYS